MPPPRKSWHCSLKKDGHVVFLLNLEGLSFAWKHVFFLFFFGKVDVGIPTLDVEGTGHHGLEM
jgi:hypothetical protein